MKAVKVFFLFVMSVFLTATAYAKDLKIAYVELGGVFNNYQKTKDFDTVLQKESQDAQKQMDDLITKIRDSQNKLALLKEDEKQKMESSIDKQKVELMELQKSKRAELAKKFDDMRKEIILEIEKVVSDLAKRDSYNYIFNDSVMLYAEKESNVTEEVLKVLNEQYKSKK